MGTQVLEDVVECGHDGQVAGQGLGAVLVGQVPVFVQRQHLRVVRDEPDVL